MSETGTNVYKSQTKQVAMLPYYLLAGLVTIVGTAAFVAAIMGY